MGQKHPCEQAGQPGEESFKISDDGEEVVEQRVQGDMVRRDLVISRGLKGDHIKHMHINEGTPTGKCHGQSTHIFSSMTRCIMTRCL